MNETTEQAGVGNQTSASDRGIRVTYNGQSALFAQGVTALDAMRKLSPEGSNGLLCAQRGGVCVELDQPLLESCELTALRYADEEGRRVYERSLRFLLLLSLKRLFPQKRARRILDTRQRRLKLFWSISS